MGHSSKPQANREQILKLYESGLTMQEVASQLDISYGSVHYWLHKYKGHEYELCDLLQEMR